MNAVMRINYRIWLLSLFILPFIQGGYFNYAVLGFGVIHSIVLGVVIVSGKFTFRIDGVRLFAIGLFILNLLNFESAIDIGMQPFGILRNLVPVMVILCYDSFKAIDEKQVNHQVANTFIISATFMALIVIGSIVVLPNPHVVRSFFIQESRLGGFFQYANTFGIYIFGAIVLVIYKNPPTRLRRSLLMIFTMMIALSQSRMTFVVLSVYSLILCFFLPKHRKDIFWMGLGFILSQGILYFLLPEFNVYRSYDLDMNASEFQSRLLYYEDGISMIRQRLRGYGYMGYYYTQRFFQTGATYHVRYIHSSVLQASLDYGILAGGLFIGQLVFFLNKILQSIRQKKIEKAIGFIGITGFFLHSFADFDVQFIAYVILLYMLVLIIDDNIAIKSVRLQTAAIYLIGAWVAIFTVAYAYFLIPAIYTYQGEYEKALEAYPYYTKAMTGWIHEGYNQEEDFDAKVQRFVEQNAYYYEGFAFLREYYYNSGDLKKSLFYSYQCKKLAPLWIENYARHLDISYLILHGRYEAGTLSKDDSLFSEIFRLEYELEQLEKERGNSYNIKHKAQFSLTPQMTRRINMTHRLYDAVME